MKTAADTAQCACAIGGGNNDAAARTLALFPLRADGHKYPNRPVPRSADGRSLPKSRELSLSRAARRPRRQPGSAVDKLKKKNCHPSPFRRCRRSRARRPHVSPRIRPHVVESVESSSARSLVSNNQPPSWDCNATTTTRPVSFKSQ